jgi:predicted permease
MYTPLQRNARDPLKNIDYVNRVLAQVRVLPGVESAAFSAALPFEKAGYAGGYLIEGQTVDRNTPDAMFRNGTSEYLQTLGVKLIEGRMFNASDTPTSPVFIINETFARHYWPHESAVGHRIAFSRAHPNWRTIVGVVADVHERGYELAIKPVVYSPVTIIDDFRTPDYLVVRTTVEPTLLAQAVRRIVTQVDPEQPVTELRTMDEIVAFNVAGRQQQMTLLGAFAALALLLASIGLYGVLSYAVTQRSREIGLRMALGATAGSVIRLIVGRGLALTGMGLAIGLVAAWAATRAMKNLLYGVAATDPLTFASVAALLGIIALIACWAPARRASRVDPITVLREE